ncbi:hypothetical protein EON80_07565 [bacterium]|nr:MAG: hypothetical protein EON80_07565 [bacterium]
MAIKIDLLPGYVKLRRNLNRSIVGCVIAAGVVFTGLSLVLKQRQLELETLDKNLEVMTARATEATTAANAETAAKAASAPAESSIAFMSNVSKTGSERAVLLDMIRDAINEDTIVQSIDISDGAKCTIKATVRTPDEYAAFLLNLRKASATQGGALFKADPVSSGPGGFANGAAPFVLPTSPTGEPVPIVYPISITAVGDLKNPYSAPADPTAGAAAAAPGGAPGIGGPGMPPSPGMPSGTPPAP